MTIYRRVLCPVWTSLKDRLDYATANNGNLADDCDKS